MTESHHAMIEAPGRIGTALTVVALLAGMLVGCGATTRIPPGAQAVHVTATDTELRLDPSTVRAGDVYLVLESSAESVDFVSRVKDMNDPNGPPLPLSDDDIASIKRIGSAQGTQVGVFSVGGYGSVFKIGPLLEGKYAFLIDGNQGGDAWSPSLLLLAVLEVLP